MGVVEEESKELFQGVMGKCEEQRRTGEKGMGVL